MSIFSNTDIYVIKDSTSGKKVIQNGIQKSTLSILLSKGVFNPTSIEFLKTILTAIGFDIDKDCIIREFDFNERVSIHKVKQQDKSKFILSFGLDISAFDIQAKISMYKWNHFDSLSLLLSDNLDKIKSNINLKRNLWIELKKTFNG